MPPSSFVIPVQDHGARTAAKKHREKIRLRVLQLPLARIAGTEVGSPRAFGWAKTIGGMAQTVYRGLERVRSRLIMTMAANNLARLPRLLAA